jgi:hypothetical protein
MQAFQFYIEDDRYSVPSLLVVETATAARARELAMRQLQRSPHYSSIAVYSGHDYLFVVGRQGGEHSASR